MAKGYSLLGRALSRAGVDTAFFIMGGPMNDGVKAMMSEGIRCIDVRHEQAAAMMAQAYARVRSRPGVCMGASGPGTINLTTGLANALIDCAPVVALGGASPIGAFGTGAFQEIDQVAVMRPITKWAERVHEPARIPECVDRAFRRAMAGKPGPVYLDLPGDVLYGDVDEAKVPWPRPAAERDNARSAAPQDVVERVIDKLRAARRPIVLTGSGILWIGDGTHVDRDYRQLVHGSWRGPGVYFRGEEELLPQSGRGEIPGVLVGRGGSSRASKAGEQV